MLQCVLCAILNLRDAAFLRPMHAFNGAVEHYNNVHGNKMFISMHVRVYYLHIHACTGHVSSSIS